MNERSLNLPFFSVFANSSHLPFDWDDLSNNSTSSLLYTCQSYGLNVEYPPIKTQLIRQVKKIIDDGALIKKTQIYPAYDYLNSQKNNKPKRRESENSISSQSSCDSFESLSLNCRVGYELPIADSSTKKRKRKSSSSETSAPKAEEPIVLVEKQNTLILKFLNLQKQIVNMTEEKQKTVFRLIFLVLHIVLLTVYFIYNDYKFIKKPRL